MPVRPFFDSRVRIALAAVCFFIYGFLGCGKSYSPALPDTVDFNYDIRPILVQKCYLCHGPDPGSRKGNLRLDTYEGATALSKEGTRAIDPGHANKSMLVFRINHTDPDIQMPTPESNLKLTDRERALIEKWIDQGAQWKPHWAFIPPKETTDLKDNTKAIDAFITKKLEDLGLNPSPEASKETLLRRVAYVLTGLPPTEAESAAFLNDPAPDAYAQMVDRYLNSPRFGEQWARHWMDLVRYAETKGHEFDYTIPGAWRYRDYLIRAFNADLPYDQLVREHLAGDLLPKPRIDQRSGINESQLATLFFALPEGTHSPVDIRKDEADRIDNTIDVTGKTFQGLTISCARCHDHKFDPIATKDYYSLYGVIEGTRFTPIPANAQKASKNAFAIRSLNDSIRQLVLRSWMERSKPSNTVRLTNNLPPSNNPQPTVIGDFRGSSLDGWRSDGMAFGGRTTLGDPVFDARGNCSGLQTGKASSRLLGTGIYGALRSPDFTINKNFLGVKAAGKKSSIRIIIDNFQLISYPIYGGMDQRVDSAGFLSYIFDVTQWKGHKAYIEMVPGYFETHVFKMPNDAWIEARYAIHYDSVWTEPSWKNPSSLIPIADGQTVSDPDQYIQTLNRSGIFRQLSLPAELSAMVSRRNAFRETLTDSTEFFNGVTDGFGKNSPVFIRGNHLEPSPEPVRRQFLRAVSQSPINLDVPGSGRLQLAASITDPANPLTARVMVNRIWHHLFGKGIVETVDNFGMQGKLPTHPELLDHLAIRFQQDHYSIKKMIRSILLTETFKRSVQPNDKARSEDPSNNLLSHYPVRRLEAENIRDALLSVSGQLDTTMFGPPIPVHITSFMNGRGKPSVSGPLDGSGRRSIYIEVRRNFLDPLMTTFDQPIPFTAFGKRTVTNVPAQSLILLNDPFVLQEAEAMAAALLKEKRPPEAAIQWIYRRCFSRPATSEEQAEAIRFLGRLKSGYISKGIQPTDKLLWKDYIHAVFNLKEFIYLN